MRLLTDKEIAKAYYYQLPPQPTTGQIVQQSRDPSVMRRNIAIEQDKQTAKIVREETLKEVGKWLEKHVVGVRIVPDEMTLFAIDAYDVAKLSQGVMPE